MKTLQRMILVLMMAVCIFSILPQNIVKADAISAVEGVKVNEGTKYDGLQKVVGRLLGFLRIASGLVAILMIAITGFNYIVGTPDVKDEMKKKMLPIIIGLILVFGAVSIATFILNAVDTKPTNYSASGTAAATAENK